MLRSAEEYSSHPVGRAIQRLSRQTIWSVAKLQELASGLSAQVSGHRLRAGSFARISAEVDVPGWAASLVTDHAAKGQTPIVVTVDGELRAVAAFADALRVDTKRSLQRLRALGFELEVLSGDHPHVVESIVTRLGVPFVAVRGGASPEAKLARIRELRAEGYRVFMVGDGVNDAAAMSAANVGHRRPWWRRGVLGCGRRIHHAPRLEHGDTRRTRCTAYPERDPPRNCSFPRLQWRRYCTRHQRSPEPPRGSDHDAAQFDHGRHSGAARQ